MRYAEFFKRQIQVARVLGIPVRIDYRWFLVFGVTLWLLASVFAEGSAKVPRLAPLSAWIVAGATTFLLFLSIFGHELAHALVGRAEGIETVEIVLHPFGGLARLRREPDSPRAEFRIAVAGPASSFIFSLASFGGMALAGAGRLWTAQVVCAMVGFWNLLLAVFNLLPGYPLDGGRVLRGLLWHRTGRLEEATRTASLGGQVIAWTLIVIGISIFFMWGEVFMAVSSVLVGLFLFDAARAVMVVRRPRAGGREAPTAADAMRAPVSVEPETLVSHFVDTILPRHRQTAMLVARGRRLHGVLTLEDLKRLPRERWHLTRVAEVMRPVGPQLFVELSTPLKNAEKLLRENGAGLLAVLNGAGEVVGSLQAGRPERRAKA